MFTGLEIELGKDVLYKLELYVMDQERRTSAMEEIQDDFGSGSQTTIPKTKGGSFKILVPGAQSRQLTGPRVEEGRRQHRSVLEDGSFGFE